MTLHNNNTLSNDHSSSRKIARAILAFIVITLVAAGIVFAFYASKADVAYTLLLDV